MPPDASADLPPPSTGTLEDLVAGALEALDGGGEGALAAFLDKHPRHSVRVRELIAGFRQTGLLAHDAKADVPDRLGGFRLLRRLGSGGMGVVFLAEQEELQRTVALKVMRPDLAFFAGSRERFRREIEVIARLSHPAIVPIVATGEHDGMLWYAMQRVDGCPADAVVRQLRGADPAKLQGADLGRAIQDAGAVPHAADPAAFGGSWWAACVRLVRQAALGLEHAHGQGIVHRDVKPSNIMLTPDGRALLLDFGLARVHGDPKLTRTGSEPGSPAYMAPEQLRGHAADERADVYSLAATLFELLDLQAPFAAADPEALRSQILRGRRSGPRNGTIPTELRLVLAAAMDIDRERRYATAAAFAADLDAVLRRRPIAARPLPWRVRATRWLQRHPRAAALLLAVAVLALVLPGAMAFQQGRSLHSLRVAKLNAERSRDQALTAVNAFLTKFASGDLALLPSGRRVAQGLLEQAVAVLDGMPEDVDPEVLRRHRTLAQRWLVHSLRVRGLPGEARRQALETLALWPEPAAAPPAVNLLLAAVRSELLRLALDGNEVEDLDEHLRRAEAELARADAALRPNAAEVRARIAMDRATWCEMQGDRALAVAGLRKALDAVLADAAGATPGTIAVLQNRLGDVLRDGGDLDGASACFAAARQVLAPPDDPALGRPEELRLRAHAAWGLGRVEFLRQQWAASAAMLQEAERYAEAGVFAYPEDQDALVLLASVSTEFAQVERRRQAAPASVTAKLERARLLYSRSPEQVAADVRSKQACCVNLVVLSEQYWAAGDACRVAEIARELRRHATGDARHLSMAAWRLLQAAAVLEERGDAAAAAACTDDALEALQACDAAGWFPPIDLEDLQCDRLRGRPAFEALRERHPPSEVRRTRK